MGNNIPKCRNERDQKARFNYVLFTREKRKLLNRKTDKLKVIDSRKDTPSKQQTLEF